MARLTLLLLFLLACGGRGDVLTVGSTKHQGMFEGFEKRKFLFRDNDGNLMRQDRMGVRGLTLDKPREITLYESGNRNGEKVLLVGYGQSRFTVKQDEKERAVSGMRVTKIEAEIPMFNEAAAGRSQRGGLIPKINTSDVEGNPSLSETQKQVLAQYKTARSEYERFVKESTALVHRMDAASGAEREELITRLRKRKADEQPVVQALQSAETALLAAFPNARRGNGGKTPKSELPSTGGSTPPKGQTTLPDVGKDQVLLIDVGALEALPDLTAEQTRAIRAYKGVAKRYRDLAAKQVTAEEVASHNAQLDKLTARLKTAEFILLKAFPGIKFAE